jgi:hypothetical protein
MVDCSSSCFSSSATLQLESGAVVPMSSVHVGDRVLSMTNEGKPTYDKVFRITHYEPNEVTSFRRITTSSGDVLEITAEHLLHIGELFLPMLRGSLTSSARSGSQAVAA